MSEFVSSCVVSQLVEFVPILWYNLLSLNETLDDLYMFVVAAHNVFRSVGQ